MYYDGYYLKKILVSHMSMKSDEWLIESSGRCGNKHWKQYFSFHFVGCEGALICCLHSYSMCIVSELFYRWDCNHVEHLGNRILSQFVIKQFWSSLHLICCLLWDKKNKCVRSSSRGFIVEVDRVFFILDNLF